MSLLIVGTIAFDKIHANNHITGKILGGSATYIGIASYHLGATPNIISVVGADFPNKYFEILKNHNFNLSGVEIIKNEKTFFWEGKYLSDMNQRETLKTELNSLSKFNPKVPKQFCSPKIVMLGNLDPRVQLGVLDQLNTKPSFTITDTMNFWIENTPNKLKEVIKKTDLLIINDEETKQYSNNNSLIQAGKYILTQGPKYLIIKKGENGALIMSKNKKFFVPALPIENVVDPTGAGDSFAGGLIGYLNKVNKFDFESLKKGMIYGSSIASITVEGFGVENISNMSNESLKTRINDFINLIKIAF